MIRRVLLLSAATTAFLFAASCSSSNSSFVGDGGLGQTPPVEAGPEAGDEDAGPTGCAGDWCIVPLPGILNTSVNAIWGSGPTDIWAVGTRGFAAHFDGTNWAQRNPETLLSLFTIWGSGPSDVWVGNTGKALFHWQGSAWEEKQIADDEGRPVLAIRGSGPDNYVALLEPQNTRFMDCPGESGPQFAVCPAVYRFSNIGGELAWREASTPEFLCGNLFTTYCGTLTGLWVGANGEPWFVGAGGRALRPTEGAPPPSVAASRDETHSIVTLEAVAGTSDSDVWAVGATGTIRHYTGGSEWSYVASPTSSHLRAVWAASATEAWAVGDDGAIVRWDGTAWRVSPTPLATQPRHLYAVWGTPGGDTWAAGDRVLLHRQSKGAQ